MARSARPQRASERACGRAGARPAAAFVTDSTRRRRWPRGLKGQQRRRPHRRLGEGCPRPGARPRAPCALPPAPSSHDPAPFRPAPGLGAQHPPPGGFGRAAPLEDGPEPLARLCAGASGQTRARPVAPATSAPVESARAPGGSSSAWLSAGHPLTWPGRGRDGAVRSVRRAASPLLLSLCAEPPTTFLSVAPERSFSPDLCSLLRSRLPTAMMEPAGFFPSFRSFP
uniref:translation initiation factor IF-2-like n=1 Tax=Arvicanthis niloticus TaxID=61156 RepID=UPI0014868299|nr:translation initiation factor IF-2-like [Arvicanthis niloticus]